MYFILWQVHNPATGEVIANVSCMGGKETKDAISSAFDAFNCKNLWLNIYVYMIYSCAAFSLFLTN